METHDLIQLDKKISKSKLMRYFLYVRSFARINKKEKLLTIRLSDSVILIISFDNFIQFTVFMQNLTNFSTWFS